MTETQPDRKVTFGVVNWLLKLKMRVLMSSKRRKSCGNRCHSFNLCYVCKDLIFFRTLLNANVGNYTRVEKEKDNNATWRLSVAIIELFRRQFGM